MGAIFYVVYCVIAYMEYFPRLIKLLKTKSSEDYSIGSNILDFIALICWLAYLCTTEQELILYIGAIIDILLCGFFTALVIFYQRTSKNKRVQQNNVRR